jgi:hypothetical protein
MRCQQMIAFTKVLFYPSALNNPWISGSTESPKVILEQPLY